VLKLLWIKFCNVSVVVYWLIEFCKVSVLAFNVLKDAVADLVLKEVVFVFTSP
jgi:hypothetical protein